MRTRGVAATPDRWARRTVLGLAGGAGRVPRDLLPGGAFERFVADLAANDQFSGTVLLAHRGRPVLTLAHGMSNVDSSVPNRADTRFGLASITKVFTAVAILRLVAEGRVSLQEKLGTYVDGFPAEIADEVAIHHLLTHTAGVGRSALNPPQPPGREEWDTVREVWEGTLEFLRGLPRQPFPPGAEYRYSNDGFFVLGAVVEAVAGMPYYDYVREKVFRLAGMADTDFDTRPEVLADERVARPYATRREDGTRYDFAATTAFPFVGDPANGAFSTAADLLRLAEAVWDGRLLGRTYTELMTSGKVPTRPADHGTSPEYLTHYGYGHVATVANGMRVSGHSGSGPGAANNIDVYPDLGWVAIVLSNYDTPVRPIVELARRLITQQCD